MKFNVNPFNILLSCLIGLAMYYLINDFLFLYNLPNEIFVFKIIFFVFVFGFLFSTLGFLIIIFIGLLKEESKKND